MGEHKNIIVISLDEVRPDHIGCYGYRKIETPHIDQVATEGVRFETCITSADFTPIAMGTVITGLYPHKHGMRDPYCQITGPSIARILKGHDYVTAGFVGNGLLAKQHGFAEGFDFWNEATKDTSFVELEYAGSGMNEIFYEGNYWVEDFFNWLREHHKDKFFVWGHLYETHESSEHSLLKKGMIQEGVFPEFAYYDAKIRMADEKLIGRLLKSLDELQIADRTILAVMSDHGTNLEDRPAKTIPWRKVEKKYPQHTTMYDHDLKVMMLMRGQGIPKSQIVKGMVGSVSLVPTLLDLIGVSAEDFDFDGKSLVPFVQTGKAVGNEIYSEDLFELRGEGALQSIRTDAFKFIRNLTQGTEEYYDLETDPYERNNVAERIDREVKIGLRKKLNVFLKGQLSNRKRFSQEKKDEIDKRLRMLGYIK